MDVANDKYKHKNSGKPQIRTQNPFSTRIGVKGGVESIVAMPDRHNSIEILACYGCMNIRKCKSKKKQMNDGTDIFSY